MQNNFLDKHYTEFEDSEENKFVYTDIHKEYVSRLKILQMFETVNDRILKETVQVSFYKISILYIQVDVIEKYIANQLTSRMPDFCMSDFSKHLV